jgi:hypothetical protein
MYRERKREIDVRRERERESIMKPIKHCLRKGRGGRKEI